MDYGAERAELDAVLASKRFARAPSLSKMLSYICGKYFRGEAASIKEYNIAVEALGRTADFNPAEDSIVRVEASRLRKRLSEYYDTEGSEHLTQVRLPESGYVPQFVFGARREAADGIDAHTGFGGSGPIRKPAQPSATTGLVLSPAACTTDARGVRRTAKPRYARKAFVSGIAMAAVIAIAALAWSVSRPLWSGVQRLDPLLPLASGSTSVPGGEEIRIASGFSGPSYSDSMGRMWLSDRYFTGGTAVARPGARVLRTRDQALYRTAREGEFRYDIPLRPGAYELHLHFAEIIYGDTDVDSSVDGQRRFDISINGDYYLTSFDIVADAAGPNIADEKIVKNISPAEDGFLHLKFTPRRNGALLGGIEILPGMPGKIRPVRILAASNGAFDSAGRWWGADRFFLGGRMLTYWSPLPGVAESGLYAGERWGHFSYSIPVAPGTYRLCLKFSEHSFGAGMPGGGGPGTRIFHVYCNGTALLNDFDIIEKAQGANRPVDVTFHHLKPNPQGKLLIQFIPVKNYAVVNAIEVVDEY